MVALWFTFQVDKRSRDVSDQMIRSLQKIESTVERSSGDTVDLIKVAWERLLGNVGLPNGRSDASVDIEDNVKEIVAGVAAELKSDISPKRGEAQPSQHDILQRIDGLAGRLEQSLRNEASRADSVGDRLSNTQRLIVGLSPRARELVRQMVTGGHLTLQQYRALFSGEVSLQGEIRELDSMGLIGPLRGKSSTGEDEPVYWFSPGRSRFIRAALSLTRDADSSYADEVRAELAKVGYPQEWLAERREGLT
jgi:hypothetical protein